MKVKVAKLLKNGINDPSDKNLKIKRQRKKNFEEPEYFSSK